MGSRNVDDRWFGLRVVSSHESVAVKLKGGVVQRVADDGSSEGDIVPVRQLTQAAYDALTVKDTTTLYLISG